MLGVHSQQLDLPNAVKKWDGKEFSIAYMIILKFILKSPGMLPSWV